MIGKVFLVGAGPSDIGLLTLRGKEVLEQAQVVVYDALVDPSIFSLLPPDAEYINVGKRASRHLKPQSEINQILLEKALAGYRVVRLKGGDPFLFGRGGEELELLEAHGVPYEVVPGVTSAISVPAYCGIPVTHRDFCSSVHIVTGHRKTGETLDLNFKALAETKGTLVFLMGVTALRDICKGLLDAGMPSDTSAAILEKGTTAEQRAVVATLADLPEKADAARIAAPAIIVVGGVASLRERFSWVEKRPLFGCRVIVTRPRERSAALSRRLRELGAQVIELPTIETVPVPNNRALAEALDHIAQFQWLVFTSPAGVKVFMDALLSSNRDARALAGMKIAVLGAGTGKALNGYGLRPDLMPASYDSAALAALLGENVKPGDRVLLPRASQGSAAVPETLAKIGANCLDLPIYDTVYKASPLIDLKKELEAHPQTMAVFTSASTVRGFAAGAQGLDLKGMRALCIGAQTASEAQKLGMKTDIAQAATIDALVSLVLTVHSDGKE